MEESSEEWEEEQYLRGNKQDYSSPEAINYAGSVEALIGALSGDIAPSLYYGEGGH